MSIVWSNWIELFVIELLFPRINSTYIVSIVWSNWIELFVIELLDPSINSTYIYCECCVEQLDGVICYRAISS